MTAGGALTLNANSGVSASGCQDVVTRSGRLYVSSQTAGEAGKKAPENSQGRALALLITLGLSGLVVGCAGLKPLMHKQPTRRQTPYKQRPLPVLTSCCIPPVGLKAVCPWGMKNLLWMRIKQR